MNYSGGEKKIRYFVGNITEVNGGMEYGCTFLAHCSDKDEQSEDAMARKVWLGWRGGDEDDFDADGQLWSDCTIIEEPGFEEITKKEYDVLKKHLSDVSY